MVFYVVLTKKDSVKDTLLKKFVKGFKTDILKNTRKRLILDSFT